jgi:hypothetical protein
MEIVRTEDFIEYFIYPQLNNAIKENDEEEDKALQVVQQKIDEIVNSYTSNYIWHKDSFQLKSRNGKFHLLDIENKGTEQNTFLMMKKKN